MHDEALDKDAVLRTIDEAVAALQADDASVRSLACDTLGIGTGEWSACRDELIEELQEAEDWVEREEALVEADAVEAPIDSQEGPEFIPSHPTLALVQSTMEERLEQPSRGRFNRRDPKWLSVLYQRLRGKAKGKAPFVAHERPEDFRFDLPERATVALVGDWATGNVHAAAVASQIAARRPDHLIHLGDVYYSGTPREAQRFFLDMWRAYGPPDARYWALNANHDMYSGGYGYFQHILPAIGQSSSYFNLQNRWWRLIGLDTGYINHNFNTPQMAWLGDQVGGDGRTILLTHHHLLSPFRKRGDHLEQWLEPYFDGAQLFGWFWGHEHHLIEYADHRGVKCRCLGHGSLPYVPPDRRRQRHRVEIVRWETRPSPQNPSRGIHGFALLTFDGPSLDVEYVDEAGGTAWREQWR